MKYQHIIEAVFHAPWLITPEAHASIQRIVKAHMLGDAIELREGTGACGEAVEVDQVEIVDGVCVIPIGGVIGRRLSSFEKGSGAVDCEDVLNELESAELDDEVHAILLDIDSPGGMVNGTPELADAIAGCSKPVYAFSAGSIGSGAYWIAAATDGIFTTRSAMIGSIGVYIPWIDESKMLEAMGISVDLIKSGKYKGMGFPGTVLSDDQRAQLQSRVDSLAAEFKAHVRNMRSDTIGDDVMQGQMFSAAEAYANGLIDGLVDSKADALSECV